MADNRVDIVVAAAVGQARADFQELAKAVRQVSAQMGTSIASVKPATDLARSGLGGLVSRMQEFKAEQVQQGRTARFFASEISSIIPAATGGAGALRDLLGVFIEGAAGGMGFGLALEAIKFVVGQVTEEIQHHKKMQEALRDSVVASAGAQADAANRLLGAVIPLTEAEKAAREEAGKWGPTLGQMAEKIEEVKKQGPGVVAWMKAMLGNSSGLMEQQDVITRISEAMRKMTEEAKKASEAMAQVANARARSQAESIRMGAEAEAANGIKRIRLELQRALHDIENDPALDPQIKAAKRVAAEEEADRKIRQIRDAQERDRAINADKGFADLEAQGGEAVWGRVQKPTGHEQSSWDIRKSGLPDGGFSADEYADAFARAETEMAGTVEQHKAAALVFKADLDEITTKTRTLTEVATTVGEAFGTAFAQMVKGTKSFSASVQTMAKAVLSAVLDKVKKEIMAERAAAAIKAFNSQGDIPIVGPVLGFAAAAAAFAFADGLIAQLPSAAGGFDIPAGLNPVTQLHSREMVLPAPLAERVRDMTDGDGGGAVIHHHWTIHATDAASFERQLNTNDSALLRTLSRLSRERRFG